MREVWFAKLATLVVPFADSDASLAAAALQIAAVMGERAAPATTFAKLDQIFQGVVRDTEAGLGGDPALIMPAVTDALIASGTRAVFTANP
jgi:hypothetical protein